MLCNVMLCYAMLCNVMSCHVMKYVRMYVYMYNRSTTNHVLYATSLFMWWGNSDPMVIFVPSATSYPSAAGEARLEEWHRRWRSWLRHCLTMLWLGPKIQRPWEIQDGWQLKVFASPKLLVFGTLYQENDGFYPIWMADISAHVTYCTHLHCGLRLQHPRIQRHVSIHTEC